MGSAMTIGAVMGGLNAAGSLINSAQQSAQFQSQANAAKAQARVYEQQARQREETGRVEAQRQDEQKSKIRKAFEDLQSRNRSLLGAGNVDMTSGSALQVAQGNIENFSQDMGDNAYATAMKEWSARQDAERLKTSAANARAQADSLTKQSYNAFPSLLNAAISGASGFASGYTMAGGSLKNLWKK